MNCLLHLTRSKASQHGEHQPEADQNADADGSGYGQIDDVGKQPEICGASAAEGAADRSFARGFGV